MDHLLLDYHSGCYMADFRPGRDTLMYKKILVVDMPTYHIDVQVDIILTTIAIYNYIKRVFGFWK